MTRLGFALWLLAVAALIAAASHIPPPRQCPPECADCGHSWGPSNKPWCTPKNMKGMK